MYSMIPCDATSSRTGVYKRRQLKRGEIWSFVCIARWKAGKLSAMESTVTVIISDLLTVFVSKSSSAVIVIISELLSVCVANPYKSNCSCYLCYVFFLNIWE
ncbi:hypothetical protein AVEN_224511-1 [Araneus ventricosus]|uniref:Uncharacterized protein n=1 Tax=Araneus ventricosus TaxID=182803 RepID=A0A4Y2JFR8_ARAVE|nr:hypothetical protein AVEN_224511-1 [Araneus ventricosus]